MDWADERYVRLYTRDTADLLAFGWEGRLVWYELLRKADRAGVLDHGGDIGVVAELLRVPADVFERGIERIVRRGAARLTETAIVIPNYLAAQEAAKSDRLRQQESRAKRRADAMAPRTGAGVTNRDAMPSQAVTNGHDESQASRNVTPSLAVPSLAIPGSLRSPRGRARKEPPSGLPESWGPGEGHRKLATELGVDLDRELARFRDHHAAKGSRFADWDAALRTWLRNAHEFAQRDGRAPAQPLAPKPPPKREPYLFDGYASSKAREAAEAERRAAAADVGEEGEVAS